MVFSAFGSTKTGNTSPVLAAAESAGLSLTLKSFLNQNMHFDEAINTTNFVLNEILTA